MADLREQLRGNMGREFIAVHPLSGAKENFKLISQENSNSADYDFMREWKIQNLSTGNISDVELNWFDTKICRRQIIWKEV